MHAAQKESNKSATVNPGQHTPAAPSTQGQATPTREPETTGASTSQASVAGDQESTVTLGEKVERLEVIVDNTRLYVLAFTIMFIKCMKLFSNVGNL